MSYHPPRVYHLSGSVGACGSNNPDDVKAIQQMVNQAGYHLASGRSVRVSGQCDGQTLEAIIWYQRLLNMSPSGLVQPVDTWFMQALKNALEPHWRPRHTAGPLRVREGQITFDAEGLDYITAAEPFRQPLHLQQFSRILHWPGGNSGVTIGRGYDMKDRSAGKILTEIKLAGIEEYKAVICSKAAGLYGREAAQFVSVYGRLIGEITHVQQIRLFDISYTEKVQYAKGVYMRGSSRIENRVLWEDIDIKIRETFVDVIYQGISGISALIKVIATGGGRDDIIRYIETDPRQTVYPERLRVKIRNLR
ncbi:hypothetical protein GCM10023078_08170 [Gibbsiella greigii]